MADHALSIQQSVDKRFCCFGRTSQDGDKSSSSKICLVGKRVQQNTNLLEVLKNSDAEVTETDDGHEFVASTPGSIYFILDDFEGDLYETLRKASHQVLGPTALIQLLQKHEPLTTRARPLYNLAMQNLTICFSGFKRNDELVQLANIVHHMGGSIRKEQSLKVTHYVANATTGEKYRYAVSMGLPIMSEEWLWRTWERRNDPNVIATQEDLVGYKVKPFFTCCIAICGFPEGEQAHMESLIAENGGSVSSLADTTCTHVVIEESTDCSVLPDKIASRAHLMRSEWFWSSIQMDACADEALYRYKAVGNVTRSGTPFSPPSGGKTWGRRRKRLRDTLGQLAAQTDLDSSLASPVPGGKRRSNETSVLSGSFFDATISPDKAVNLDDMSPDAMSPSPPQTLKPATDLKSMSPRQRVAMELLQTETNYVSILRTIIKVFKEPLECPDQVGWPLLDHTEIKLIFGNLPPIYEVHTKLCDDLSQLLAHWKENSSVGSIILKHSKDLQRAYPPFVNFFEKSKETLTLCDSTKQRFHAFLKIGSSKPECGRQTLAELMIRPVQRLPSVLLLLSDILKHTNKNNNDSEVLVKAIAALKDAMTHINEDKRRTEGQVVMFDIVNDIENCPPHLLSSHRAFINKVNVTEINGNISGKGDHLTLFLFTDVIEVCKRRLRNMNTTFKNPSTLNLQMLKNTPFQKPYKHLELTPLSHVKRVIDIKETEDCHNTFAMVCRSNLELKERLWSFVLTSEEVDKLQYLRTMCNLVATVTCRTDAEYFLTTLEPKHLSIDSSDLSSNTLTRAVKLASKTTKKVGRAFSFNKTPRKLKRAVSSMISPFHSSGTPTSSMLAQESRVMCTSVMNLNEEEDSDSSDAFECPPSPGASSYHSDSKKSSHPDRKVKSLGFSTTHGRRM